MRTTSSTSETSALSVVVQLVTGALVLAGLAAVLWLAASRRDSPTVDPQAEIDRRIDDLEQSLSRLQDVFGQPASG